MITHYAPDGDAYTPTACCLTPMRGDPYQWSADWSQVDCLACRKHKPHTGATMNDVELSALAACVAFQASRQPYTPELTALLTELHARSVIPRKENPSL